MDEKDERALNLAARAMQRRFGASGTEEDIEAALSDLFAPILAESRNATRYADEVTTLRGDLAASNALKVMWEDRALAAEAALAAEREENAVLSKKLEIALAGLQRISDIAPKAAAAIRAQGE